MPGVEAVFDALLAVVAGGLLVARIRATRAGRDVPIVVAIATGVVLGYVTVLVAMIPILWIRNPS
jgi:hypothetical protein